MSVLPRAAVCLMAGAALGITSKELIEKLSEPASEEISRIEACAAKLGEVSIAQIGLARDCEPLEPRFFSYGVNGGTVYVLPTASQLRESKQAVLPNQERSDEAASIVGYGLGGAAAITLFLGLTSSSQRRTTFKPYRTETAN